MTPTEICSTVHVLRAQGHSLREISRLLNLSRNTVRRILREPPDAPAERHVASRGDAHLDRIMTAFTEARGNAVRVQELLATNGIDVAYSSLTRWIREAELRAPPQRAGEFSFACGAEMQPAAYEARDFLRRTRVLMRCEALEMRGRSLVPPEAPRGFDAFQLRQVNFTDCHKRLRRAAALQVSSIDKRSETCLDPSFSETMLCRRN